MIKKLLKIILVLVVILLGLITAGVFIVAEDTALVNRAAKLSDSDIETLRNIVKENDPIGIVQTNKKKMRLTVSQINQLLAYASNRFDGSLRARAITEKNRAYVKSSIVLPDNPFGEYLNFSGFVRVQHSKYFVIEQLKVGKLPVPELVVTILQPLILEELNSRFNEYFRLWDYLRRIDLTNNGVSVHYRLERSDLADLKKLGRKLLVNTEMKERALAYVAEMERLLNLLPAEKQSLTRLLSPMFLFAELRSQKNNQVVEENRMALLVMGAYMTGRNPAKYISDQPVKPFRKIKFTLKNRNDLAQHYLISGAINAVSGTAWSNAIGLEKELKDSDGGSGFSFVDLMADIAGNKLAQSALSESSAAKLQSKMARLSGEESIMGDIGGLAEGLTSTEFRLEYGNTNSDEYITVVREIERRLFQCDAYR